MALKSELKDEARRCARPADCYHNPLPERRGSLGIYLRGHICFVVVSGSPQHHLPQGRAGTLDPTASIPADSSLDAKDFMVMKASDDHWARAIDPARGSKPRDNRRQGDGI
jgi:hypothetical protein